MAHDPQLYSDSATEDGEEAETRPLLLRGIGKNKGKMLPHQYRKAKIGAVITAVILAVAGGVTAAIILTRKSSNEDGSTTVEFENNSPYTLRLTDQSGEGVNATAHLPELRSGERQTVVLDNATSWTDLEYDIYDANNTYMGHSGIRVVPSAVMISDEDKVFVTTVPAQSSTSTKVTTTPGGIRPGLNEGGFEFDYTNPPTPTDVNTANANSYSSIRLPFKLEKASSDGFTIDPNSDYVKAYLAQVEVALQHNNEVIVEPHNYMQFNGKQLTPEQCQKLIGGAFVGLFKDLTARINNNKLSGKLMVEAMNEPTDAVTPQELVDCYKPLIKEARNNGYNGTIGIEGNTWATPSVLVNEDGTPTEQFNVLLPLLDENQNGDMELDVHCYFDGQNGGGPGTGECVTANSALQLNRIPQLTALARQHNIKIRITETGVINTPNCLQVLDDLMAHIYNNADVYKGYNAWVQTPLSTPAWSPLLLDLDPDGKDVKDPRYGVMKKYITRSSASTASSSFFQPAPIVRSASGPSAAANFNGSTALGLAAIPAIGGALLLLWLFYYLYKKHLGNSPEPKITDVEKGGPSK